MQNMHSQDDRWLVLTAANIVRNIFLATKNFALGKSVDLGHSTIGQYAYRMMWIGVSFFILFLPLGRSFREAGFILSTFGLLLYYAVDYKNSNLKRFGGMIWIYILFLTLIILKTFCTIDLARSFYALESNLYRGFPILFTGMEIVRRKRNLKTIVILFSIMSLYEGLDGVYQYVVGQDLFFGMPIRSLYVDSFRLTGSFVRVGNLLSISLVISLGLIWILPKKWPLWRSMLFTVLVLVPGAFLLIHSKTRSSYVGVAAALLMLWILLRGFDWKKILIPLNIGLGVLLLGPKRISLDQALQDGRIVELWPFAWKVFQNWPLLGAGINTYTPAFNSLGLVPVMHTATISHPHSIYLQFLAETGIVGFTILITFFATYTFWCVQKIIHGVRAGVDREFWKLLSVFACAFVGYLATAISAHNFFNSWWLGLSMLVLGTTIGGCLTSERLETQKEREET